MAEGERNDPMPGKKQQSYIFGMGPRFGNLSLPLYHRIIIQLNIRDFHEISGRSGANGLANDLVRMYLQYLMRSGTFRYHGWKCNFFRLGHHQLLRHCFGSLAASKATMGIDYTCHCVNFDRPSGRQFILGLGILPLTFTRSIIGGV